MAQQGFFDLVFEVDAVVLGDELAVFIKVLGALDAGRDTDIVDDVADTSTGSTAIIFSFVFSVIAFVVVIGLPFIRRGSPMVPPPSSPSSSSSGGIIGSSGPGS